MESRPEGLRAPKVLRVFDPWRCLRRSSPTLTYVVGKRASLANSLGSTTVGYGLASVRVKSMRFGSWCTPRPRLPASRGPMKPPALSTISPHSALEFRVLRRWFHCAATRVASCPCHACCEERPRARHGQLERMAASSPRHADQTTRARCELRLPQPRDALHADVAAAHRCFRREQAEHFSWC